ncbi:hypothetical protein [Geofilum rubicundum]|uniref:CCDC81-like prokaryotic HU domain-containing protein n=1 Tax=Geofilum rubicundum JCM 15548 TaxID=1236989 RepID=A0A0E9LSX6_9BACT|nr:hypothetical protein [Geofilum rubicundum]GAO28383.1 hypothetical protein JCM15548_1468 [Geofilum rubicundum JCM 15548]
MENYLLELIRENNRIIIPNFGAFIVSREKGQNILFNNFLSFNDGLLISHICAVEGVDSATAAQKVEDYVARINHTLDEKGLFEIEGIGRFTKDDSGVLRFEQVLADEDEGPQDEAPLTSAGTQVNRGSDDGDLLDLDPSGVEEVPSNTPPPPAQEDRNHRTMDEPAPYSAGSAMAGIPSLQEVDHSTKDIPERPASEDHVYIKKEDRKGPVGLIVLILLILLLLVGSTLWFFTGVFDEFKNRAKQEAAETEQVDVPEITEEPPAEEEIGFVEEEVVEEPVVVSTRQHHIIVGSFRDEAKAQEQMNTLLGKGYETAPFCPMKADTC